MDTAPAPEAVKPKTSYGTIAGLLIIVAAIVVAALYFLNERIGGPGANPTDPASIQDDLDAAPSEEFEQDVDGAFVELDAALEAQ